MKNIQVKTRIADSTIDLTFLILVWEVIRITAGVLGSRSHTRNHYTCMWMPQTNLICTEWWYLTCKSYRKCNDNTHKLN